MEIANLKQIFKHEIKTNRIQKKENKNIIETFLNSIEDNTIENNTIENNTIENNTIENNTIEHKTHPTATMIKESFLNFADGDWLGFQKSYFLKIHRKNGDMFRILDKTENYWNWNLFIKKNSRIKCKDNLTDDITTLHNKIKNTKINCNFKLGEITNIFNKFDNNTIENNIENNTIENNTIENNTIENDTIENNTIEYKTHPIAKTKTKAIKTPALVKEKPTVTAAPKTESSSTNGNKFKVIDVNHVPSGDKSFYIYFPFGTYLYKIVKVVKSPTGQKEYIVDRYETSNWTNAHINNKEHFLLKFKNSSIMTRELTWKELFFGYRRALMLSSFDFNKPLVVSLDEFQYNAN